MSREGRVEVGTLRQGRIGACLELLGIFVLVVAATTRGASAETGTVTAGEAKKLLENRKATVVDVRGPGEFQDRRIEGAVNIPEGAIKNRSLSKKETLVLYCSNEDCPLARMAAESLEKKGHQNVLILEGGLAAWQGAGYSTVSEPKKEKRPAERLSAKKLREKMKQENTGVKVLDVRSQKEFKAGHIGGAKNVVLEDLESLLSKLDKDVEWAVFDKDPERRKKALDILEAAGMKASEIREDLSVWAARGYPVEAGMR